MRYTRRSSKILPCTHESDPQILQTWQGRRSAHLTSLRTLDTSRCPLFALLPPPRLHTLKVRNCSMIVKDLPDFIWTMHKLRTLSLDGRYFLRTPLRGREKNYYERPGPGWRWHRHNVGSGRTCRVGCGLQFHPADDCACTQSVAEAVSDPPLLEAKENVR